MARMEARPGRRAGERMSRTKESKSAKPAPPPKPAKRSRQIRPDSQREAAFIAWAELRSIRGAAAKTGVPSETLRLWIHDPAEAERVGRIRADHARARDAKTRRAIAKRYHDVVADTADARTTLANGRAGNASTVQVQAARETFAAAVALDKIARLDSGQPTERISVDTRTDAEVAEAARREVLADPALRTALGLP